MNHFVGKYFVPTNAVLKGHLNQKTILFAFFSCRLTCYAAAMFGCVNVIALKLGETRRPALCTEISTQNYKSREF
jgi:hypothetical protein